ncbi:hypothetical protein ACFQ21_00215 [Ohtaekwangia kribbensis]|uniref:Uncharacterized protein n=1 Tax=Ohtaekwangia kribbensis TaxID=688913 RepID=A0ABW3JVV9_9BACT
MSKSSSSGIKIGFYTALAILFIALKLTHVIDWSWVWVLAPIWISAGLAIVAIVVVVILAINKAKKEEHEQPAQTFGKPSKFQVKLREAMEREGQAMPVYTCVRCGHRNMRDTGPCTNCMFPSSGSRGRWNPEEEKKRKYSNDDHTTDPSRIFDSILPVSNDDSYIGHHHSSNDHHSHHHHDSGSGGHFGGGGSSDSWSSSDSSSSDSGSSFSSND